MIRLPVSPSRIGDRVALTAEERHYLVDVLRLNPGDALEVFDGAGSRYAARLLEGGAALALGAREQQPAAARPMTLAQALAKGEKMELVVQKATELGAAAIAPFTSERAVVKLAGARAEERVERWQRIAAAAAGQCGRADVPRVLPICSLDALLDRAAAEGARALVLYEEERERRLSQAALADARPLVLVVGPEGGFSPAEIERSRARGAEVVTLGPRVLRTETVALAALAVLQHLQGDFA